MRCPYCNDERNDELQLFAGRFWMCPQHGQVGSVDEAVEPLAWLDEVIERYPYPIASCYGALRDDVERYPDPRDALRQLLRIKDVIETLVKYSRHHTNLGACPAVRCAGRAGPADHREAGRPGAGDLG